MRRAVAVLAVVAALAGASVYLARLRTPAPADTDAALAPPPGLAKRGAAAGVAEPTLDGRTRELFRLLGPSFGAQQQAAVDALAARASAAELAALVRAVAGLPSIAGTRYANEALLGRYAALDPAAAVALARDVDAPLELLATLHVDWARADPEAALRALDAYDAARAARIARELLGVLGNDDEAVQRLLAAAPRLDADRLRADAAVARAQTDLTGALRAAARLPAAERRDAFARVAAQGASDFVTVLRGAAVLDRVAGSELAAAVLREWAKRDPEAMLEYTLSLDPEAQRAAVEDAGLEAFAQLPPDRVIAILDRLPDGVAQEVRTIERLALARADPLAAIGYAEALPPGPERTRALELAARGYAMADPEGALAWAQRLSPPNPAIVASALAAFARVDPDRAIALLLTQGRPEQRFRDASALVTGGALDSDHVDALLRAWASAGGDRSEMQTLVGNWARRDPERAVEWLLRNDERTAASRAYTSAAEALGKSDPAAAAAYLDKIPRELRALWIEGAASGYASADPAGAASWVAQYAGEQGYGAALVAVAQSTARRDPRAAAALLRQLPGADTPASVRAAATIARRWTALDAPAARTWALSLPPGGTRDSALSPVLGAVLAANGGIEPALLDAFSSDSAAQRALAQAVIDLALRDRAAARTAADRYLVDPSARRDVDRFIGDR